MPRGLWPRLRATALLIAVAAGLLVLGLLSTKGLAWASEFASIAGFFLALVALIWPWLVRQMIGPRPVSAANIADSAEELAGALGRQWAEEEEVRNINDPDPLPVRWEVTPTAEAAMLGGPGEPASPGAGPEVSSSLAGEFKDILATFERVRSRRLVILGPAGAGKSVLVTRLARDLLAAWKPGMTVPVIVTASAWDPDRGMSGWIADQMVRSHPGLARRVRTGDQEARLADFMADTVVLPIIDGLDELPDELRQRALATINARGSDRPIVLTSRPDEYLGAIAATGRAIAKAMVVELLPLEIPEVKSYLSAATPAVPEGRWTAVFHRLDEDSDGALGCALKTPLMVWLARTIYGTSGKDPGELVIDPRFGDQEAIELHLLDAFLPAVYVPRRGLPRCSWTPGQARRWLAFLASRTDQARRQELEWWELEDGVRGWRPVAFAVRAAVLWGVTLGLARWLLSRGTWHHAAHAPLADLDHLLLTGPVGRRILPAVNYLLNPLVAAVPPRWRSSPRAILAQAPWHPPASLPLQITLIALAAMAVGVYSAISDNWYRRPAALKFSVSDAARSAVVGVGSWTLVVLMVLIIGGLIGRAHGLGAVWTAVTAFVHLSSARLLVSLGVLVALAFAVIPWRGALDVSWSTSPARVLRIDRRAQIVPMFLHRAVQTVVVWLCLGPGAAVVYGAYAGIRVLSVPLAGSVRSASGGFADARIWLACSRRMPLRPMTFLTDAHLRGVLRQDGAVYQFRHIRLQQWLSAQHPPLSRRLASAAVPAQRWLHRRVADTALTPPFSMAPSAGPRWGLFFEEAAAEFSPVARLGTPVGEISRLGPGFAQQFAGAQHGWVICAQPWSAPALVAQPVWDAIRTTATGTRSEAYAALGFPTTSRIRQPVQQRIIPADARWVALSGGRWGRGLLVRDRAPDRWRWEPRESLYSPGPEDEKTVEAAPLLAQAQLWATATILWAAPKLAITQEAAQALLERLSGSEFSRAVAALSAWWGADLPMSRWQAAPTDNPAYRANAICQIAGPGGRTALVAEVGLSVRHGSQAVTLTTSARVRIEDPGAWRAAPAVAGQAPPDDRRPRLSLAELTFLLTAAWSMAVEDLPGVVADDPVWMPPAGRPSSELALSVRGTHGQTAHHCGLGDIVDFSPILDAGAPRWFELPAPEQPHTMRVTITGPLWYRPDDRARRTRDALAFMATEYGFLQAREHWPTSTPGGQT